MRTDTFDGARLACAVLRCTRTWLILRGMEPAVRLLLQFLSVVLTTIQLRQLVLEIIINMDYVHLFLIPALVVSLR